MAITMSYNPYFTDFSDMQSAAQISSGSNGFYWGDSEFSVGPDPYDTVDGRTTWDSDLSDGFDTLDTAVEIDASAAGTGLSVYRVGNVSSMDASVSTINEVDLRACTSAAMAEARWSNIVVQFYKAGKLTETVNVGTLDAVGTDDGTAHEALAQVVPSAKGDDAVVITGMMRLQCSQADSVPTACTLFCQAVIR